MRDRHARGRDRRRPQVSVEGLEVVLLIGLPGAGKSTFYRSRFSTTHAHVSKDLMPRSARHKGARQGRQIAQHLAKGRSVVVDNTNVTRADRTLIIERAHAQGASAVGFVFLSSVAESLERNARRAGRARVPDVAIFAFARRYQSPSFEEGFDALFAVRTLEDGRFEVKPIRRVRS